MTTTKAQQKATRKWNENNLDRISLTVKKGEKEIIKSFAKEHGLSLNSFIYQAIKEKMAKK